ncbi:MAG: hypothetical protein H6811_10020 [Phycisphaeraceae bacterium]|nr:hypothetical protein [Phycisphaeraceae bacterium]
MIRCIASIVMALLAATPATPATAAEPSAGAEVLLARANESFDRAVSLWPTEETLSRAAFAQSAALYDSLRRQHGIHNHRVELNLGNAAMLSGDPGRAVLAFRRAQRLRPDDPQVQTSLDIARSQVGVEFRPTRGDLLRSASLAWRRVLPAPIVVWALIVGYVLLWLIAIARIALSIRVDRRVVAVIALVAVAALGMIVIEDWTLSSGRDAVIVAPGGAEALKGPAPGVYEPSYETPRLPPGVEVRIVEERNGWSRVRLIDRRETWVRDEALERI